jgi:hypothetical protein
MYSEMALFGAFSQVIVLCEGGKGCLMEFWWFDGRRLFSMGTIDGGRRRLCNGTSRIGGDHQSCPTRFPDSTM